MFEVGEGTKAADPVAVHPSLAEWAESLRSLGHDTSSVYACQTCEVLYIAHLDLQRLPAVFLVAEDSLIIGDRATGEIKWSIMLENIASLEAVCPSCDVLQIIPKRGRHIRDIDGFKPLRISIQLTPSDLSTPADDFQGVAKAVLKTAKAFGSNIVRMDEVDGPTPGEPPSPDTPEELTPSPEDPPPPAAVEPADPPPHPATAAPAKPSPKKKKKKKKPAAKTAAAATPKNNADDDDNEGGVSDEGAKKVPPEHEEGAGAGVDVDVDADAATPTQKHTTAPSAPLTAGDDVLLNVTPMSPRPVDSDVDAFYQMAVRGGGVKRAASERREPEFVHPLRPSLLRGSGSPRADEGRTVHFDGLQHQRHPDPRHSADDPHGSVPNHSQALMVATDVDVGHDPQPPRRRHPKYVQLQVDAAAAAGDAVADVGSLPHTPVGVGGADAIAGHRAANAPPRRESFYGNADVYTPPTAMSSPRGGLRRPASPPPGYARPLPERAQQHHHHPAYQSVTIDSALESRAHGHGGLGAGVHGATPQPPHPAYQIFTFDSGAGNPGESRHCEEPASARHLEQQPQHPNYQSVTLDSGFDTRAFQQRLHPQPPRASSPVFSTATTTDGGGRSGAASPVSFPSALVNDLYMSGTMSTLDDSYVVPPVSPAAEVAVTPPQGHLNIPSSPYDRQGPVVPAAAKVKPQEVPPLPGKHAAPTGAAHLVLPVQAASPVGAAAVGGGGGSSIATTRSPRRRRTTTHLTFEEAQAVFLSGGPRPGQAYRDDTLDDHTAAGARAHSPVMPRRRTTTHLTFEEAQATFGGGAAGPGYVQRPTANRSCANTNSTPKSPRRRTVTHLTFEEAQTVFGSGGGGHGGRGPLPQPQPHQHQPPSTFARETAGRGSSPERAGIAMGVGSGTHTRQGPPGRVGVVMGDAAREMHGGGDAVLPPPAHASWYTRIADADLLAAPVAVAAGRVRSTFEHGPFREKPHPAIGGASGAGGGGGAGSEDPFWSAFVRRYNALNVPHHHHHHHPRTRSSLGTTQYTESALAISPPCARDGRPRMHPSPHAARGRAHHARTRPPGDDLSVDGSDSSVGEDVFFAPPGRP